MNKCGVGGSTFYRTLPTICVNLQVHCSFQLAVTSVLVERIFVWQKTRLVRRWLSAIYNRLILRPGELWCPNKVDKVQEETKPDIPIDFLL